MKKYIEPVLEIEEVIIEDVVASSGQSKVYGGDLVADTADTYGSGFWSIFNK